MTQRSKEVFLIGVGLWIATNTFAVGGHSYGKMNPSVTNKYTLNLDTKNETNKDSLDFQITSNLSLLAKGQNYKNKKKKLNRSTSRAFWQGRGLKLRVGMLTGYLGGFIPIFSADYVSGFSQQASWMAGGLYTNVGGIISLTILDGGVTYHFPMSRKATFEIGGRGGLYIISIHFFGEQLNFTTFGILGQVGFNFQVSPRGVIGVDGLIPLNTLGGLLPLFTYRFILG